jgi:hypothetical protein
MVLIVFFVWILFTVNVHVGGRERGLSKWCGSSGGGGSGGCHLLLFIAIRVLPIQLVLDPQITIHIEESI